MSISISIGKVAGHSILRDSEIRSNPERNRESNVGKYGNLPSDFEQEEAFLNSGLFGYTKVY